MADQKLLLTDIQFAYLVGRDSNMYLGGNATHGYMELEGNADPDRIEDALYKVMKRHEALRIVVGEDGTQTFKESFDKYHINRFDLTKMSDDEKNNFIQSYRNENTHKIYECGSFPMFGISAFKMKDDCWRYAFETAKGLSPLCVFTSQIVAGVSPSRFTRSLSDGIRIWRSRSTMPSASRMRCS